MSNPLYVGADDIQDAKAPAVGSEQMHLLRKQWPTLVGVLETYFATGKEVKFLDRYARHGEGSAEFSGLQEELKSAVADYDDAAKMVNAVLDIELSPVEARAALAELLDQITEQGDFSPESIAAAKKADKDEKADPQEMFSYYAMRKIRLWGPLSQYQVPLVGLLLIGFVLLGVGRLLASISWPTWLDWFPGMFLVLGLVVVGMSSVAMYGLRNEVREPEKAEAREKAKAEALARKEDKPRRGLRSLF